MSELNTPAPGAEEMKALLDDPENLSGRERRILETLDARTATTGVLIEQFSPRLVRTAVMKHLDILERAQLIRVERIGRTRHNHLERQPLNEVASWLDQRIQGHQKNLMQLKAITEAKPTQPNRKQ